MQINLSFSQEEDQLKVKLQYFLTIQSTIWEALIHYNVNTVSAVVCDFGGFGAA